MISTPFVPVPPHKYGGTELIIWDLVEGLTAAGHDVTLFATGDSHTSARVESLFPVGRWPPNPYHELAHASFVFERIARSPIPFDVVHTHIAAALALQRLSPLPLVYTLHHAVDDELEQYYASCPPVHAVAISRKQRSTIPSYPDATVIYHGLDSSRYAFGSGGPRVAFLGRLAREKGPADAIDAARLAGLPIRVGGKAHWKDVDYFHGEVAPRLRQDHVEYLGELGHSAKCELFGTAMATLCPVDWDEPFGLVLIESMLCGTPVLAFPRGSIPELVDPGVTGFVAADLPEMARLLRDEVPRLDRKRCRAHAIERFGRDRMVRDHEALYAAVVALRRKPQRFERDLVHVEG